MNKTTLIALFLLAALVGGVKAALDHAVIQTLETTIRQLAPLAWVTYEDAGLGLPARLNVTNVSITPHHAASINIDHFRLYGVHHFVLDSPLPDSLHLNLANINTELPWPRQVPEWMNLVGYTDWFLSDREFAALGYQFLLGDFDFRMEREGEFVNILATLENSNIGDIELRAVVTNFPPPPWAQDMWLRIRLAELHLIYKDGAFVGKVLDFLARRTGEPRAILQKTMSQRLGSDLQVVLPAQAARAIGGFVENTRQLTITLKPTQPIALSNLQRLPVRRWPLEINTN